MQWSRNMVHSHFTLCWRVCDYLKRLSQHPWYGLWMRIKGPHHYKVTALGSSVEWPLECTPHIVDVFHGLFGSLDVYLFFIFIFSRFIPCVNLCFVIYTKVTT